METGAHIPVLLDEVLEHLAIRPDGCYLDCTFGRGGHSREILRRLGPTGRLLACDRDATAVAAGAPMSRAREARKRRRLVQLAKVPEDGTAAGRGRGLKSLPAASTKRSTVR